ncbi:MAG: peptidoglycan bridge formation glycyltransferase FemA/FemB family protein [Rothia sp. (in: high G+C Gram-positive bacteria)]|nr:peptidoglycan bridge formation glycyltransferase FemA/FemB family protein [Rothia sp. (in: high G+C Gram-positive bacteria)]
MSTILQSEIWAKFQEANGHKVLKDQGPGWHFIATVEGGRTGRYLYCPYGPEAESPQAFDQAVARLRELAAAQGCWFLRVEPTNPALWASYPSGSAFLAARGFRLSPRQIQPSHTQIIDLTLSQEELLKDMKATNRNLHRNIHKKGVSFETSQKPEDLPILLGFLQETAGRVGFNRQQDAYLTKVAQVLMPADAATLYIARLEGEPVGAALVYDSDDTRVYAHAATSFAHRKLQVGNPLLSTIILDAQAKGLKTMDLFGIAPDDDPEHEWAGFTKFKKSFGGRSVSYPGTWDLPISAAGYRAYLASRQAQQGLGQARSLAQTKLLPQAKKLLAQLEQKVGKKPAQ